MTPSRILTPLQARLFGLATAFLALTGFAQMPIFKRYYIADLPGLGWLAQFYTTLALHYAAATLFLFLAAYALARYLASRPALAPYALVRAACIAGLVLTGLMRVAKNLPGLHWGPTLTMLVDWTHLGLVLAWGVAALVAWGLRKSFKKVAK
ncbi:MAG: FeS-binding protein [Desulfovibrionaceae bacterium]